MPVVVHTAVKTKVGNTDVQTSVGIDSFTDKWCYTKLYRQGFAHKLYIQVVGHTFVHGIPSCIDKRWHSNCTDKG